MDVYLNVYMNIEVLEVDEASGTLLCSERKAYKLVFLFL